MPTTRELTPEDAPELTALYEEYEWWADREVDDVRSALEETEVAIGVEDDGDLVAAARVVTDYTYYTTVFDVIVAADRRSEGLGDVLMNAVVDHPDLESVPRLTLFSRSGLVPFYESIGFEVFDRMVDVPEGGSEELQWMVYPRDDE